MSEDAQLINQLGGPASVARLLGFSGPGATARVANWRTRGIPWEIKFKHAEALRRAAKTPATPTKEPA